MKLGQENGESRDMTKRSWTSQKRKLLLETYKKLLNYTCAHPKCESGFDVEAHHIRPLEFGGEDKFWNIVCLCRKCHRSNGLHNNVDDEKLMDLYTFKGVHERTVIGFQLDEEEENFREKYLRAINVNRNFDTEERFIASNIFNLVTRK